GIHGLAVDDAAGAGGVIADHAADVGPAGGGDVGAVLEVVLGQGAVEVVQDQARLNAGGARGGVDLQHAVHVLTAVDDDARADGLAGQAGAAAARRDGHARLGADMHAGGHVGGVLRHHHAQRLHLVDAGVGGVELARGRVEAHLAFEVLVEVAGHG